MLIRTWVRFDYFDFVYVICFFLLFYVQYADIEVHF